ncbi:hypothetical protein I302_103511 [Kwoniella bestiolae CBS 10118]|uniref:Nudix hydrolase domain-containing protein n=1 Tax=Kwoniella bestiolae CBS 10118 TaxID=1296100 RepID=A0A1B9G8M7_9TREE|nr:hypothetical protein I302_02213 [Kwoniella bestiolae CBS 10118]OCF27372.1 hypothetical protein I302_02213 [Kwoniella bestiolae CBS 10118]
MIRSLLPVIEVVDNFPYTPSHSYVPFHLTLADFQNNLPALGLLRQDVLREMKAVAKGIWEFEISTGKPDETGDFHTEVICVYFTEELVKKGKEEIGRVMAKVVRGWKEEGKFPGPLAGWRNELYTIYASPNSSGLYASSHSTSQPVMVGPGTFKNVAFHLERAACALFGLATFGVHMTAYEGEGHAMKVWVPRRSKTKATWPGRLDNSVAGGITAGSTPIETMIKECDEEASLPEEFVRERVKNCGVATYFYVTDDGFLQPEVEYIYDLPLPSQDSAEYIKPKPHDDEVESFALLTIPELIEALHSGDMKPNCGLIYVDFLIRHGLITPENEPNFLEISWRMRRSLQVTMPGI